MHEAKLKIPYNIVKIIKITILTIVPTESVEKSLAKASFTKDVKYQINDPINPISIINSIIRNVFTIFND